MRDRLELGDGFTERFLTDESGAVSSDFVFLSAAVIFLALASVQVIWNSSLGVGDVIDSSLDSAELEPVVIP